MPNHMDGKKGHEAGTKQDAAKPKPQKTMDSDAMSGRCIHGRYDIIGKIGQGGMGEIYAAMDRQKGEKVVLKFMMKALSTDPESQERFENEAKAAAAIRHPNVIRIYDMDEYSGRPFMVVQYLQGMDLKDYLRKSGPMSWEKTRAIIVKMCDGIEAAHRAGIIHRDLKPQNVFMVNENGLETIKVLDLGLAKFMISSGGPLTAANMFAGTPEYAAPEMIQDKKNVGPWSDVYAIGIIMYDMMAGVLPFTSDKRAADAGIDILKMQLDTPPLPPSVKRPDLGIPSDAERIILKCMAKDRNERFQSAAELRAAVLACEGRSGGSRIAMSAGDLVLQDSLKTKIAADSRVATVIDNDAPGKKSSFGRIVKTAIAIGAVAAAGYLGHANWSRIMRAYDDLRSQASRIEIPMPDAKPAQSAPAVKPSAPSSSFMAVIESEPPGAFVYDMAKNAQIGVTPLRRELAKGEYNLIVSSGRKSQKVTISSEHPNAKVVFSRTKQAGASRPGSQGSTESPAPDKGTEVPKVEKNEPEPDNGTDDGQ
jgi:serine/threonine protein kinase